MVHLINCLDHPRFPQYHSWSKNYTCLDDARWKALLGLPPDSIVMSQSARLERMLFMVAYYSFWLVMWLNDRSVTSGRSYEPCPAIKDKRSRMMARNSRIIMHHLSILVIHIRCATAVGAGKRLIISKDGTCASRAIFGLPKIHNFDKRTWLTCYYSI